MTHRYEVMHNQPRAHTIGNVEYINEEWIFFDEESDEAFLLRDIVQDDFEIFYHNHWLPARFYEDHVLKVHDDFHRLQDGEMIRIRKQLPYAYEEWLQELSESAFHHVARALANWNYSLYDNIYCHNSLFFQTGTMRQGVNFFIYDNSEQICSLQHHYMRGQYTYKDTFSFLQADGATLSIME